MIPWLFCFEKYNLCVEPVICCIERFSDCENWVVVKISNYSGTMKRGKNPASQKM